MTDLISPMLSRNLRAFAIIEFSIMNATPSMVTVGRTGMMSVPSSRIVVGNGRVFPRLKALVEVGQDLVHDHVHVVVCHGFSSLSAVM